ncbi:MAG: glycosyltransferase [Candidatus Lokiarchaeota archaeon]|nr:glycosyltransferase [Candidatus Lokiarchaeota archaeon]
MVDKNILMLSSAEYKASSRFTRSAQMFSEKGNNVEILCCDRLYNNPKREKLDKINIRFVRSFLSKKKLNVLTMPFFLLYLYLKYLIKTIKKPKIDIIYSYTLDLLPISILLKKIKKSKLIYDSAEYYPGMIINYVPKFIYYMVRAIYYKLAKKADYVITTNKLLEYQFKLAKVKKVKIIANVPDTNIFFFNENNRNKIRNDLKIPNNTIVFSFIGFMAEFRGLEEMVQASKILSKENNNFKILIIGKGPKKQEIMRRIEVNGLKEFFIIKDFIELNSVPQYLSASDVVFILYNPDKLNNWYGVPNKLFEAMACERAVIGSNFGNLKNLINDIKCGLLVDMKNPKDIADKMKIILEDGALRTKLGKNGYNRTINEYNLKYNTNTLNKVIEELN